MAEILIEITDMSFPDDTRVAKGDTVVWTNKMNMPHTVTSNKQGEFNSPRLSRDQSFRHTFNEAGSFAYKCAIHPDDMKGTVTVKEP